MRSRNHKYRIYQYYPLHPGEIRLIKLLPGCLGDGLRCELLHEASTNSQSYEALSYTWGTNKKTHTIRVRNARVRITANLYQALYHLRQHYSERILWADAICINQDDTQERNHQVKSMAQIFSSASEVFIWLGPRHKDVELVLDTIRQTNSIITRYGDAYVPKMHAPETKNLDVPHIDDKIRHSSYDLFCRNWFSRLWIIQEAMLAKKATVKCGSLSIPFYMILRVFGHWQNKDFLPVIKLGPSKTLYSMIQIKSTIDKHHRLPLLELLLLTKCHDASDPRDKVFGLMSLVFDDSSLGFEVDYGMSCAELYTQIAKHQIVQYKGLFILGTAGLGLRSGDINLPSWVPDWSLRDSIHKEISFFGRFQAAGSTTATVRVNSNNGLEMSAIFIDKVADVGMDMLLRTFQCRGKSVLKRDRHWLTGISRNIVIGDLFSELNRLSENLDPYPTGENVDDVKLQTVGFGFLGWERSAKWVAECRSLHASCQRFSSSTFIDILDELNSDSTGRFDKYGSIREYGLSGYWYINFATDFTRCRVLCNTDKGYLGWVPDITREGDLIALFPGASVPYVVFPIGNGVYRLVGECFIHGIMYGEALEGNPPEEDITLI